MRVFDTVRDFTVWRKRQSGVLALVPTMGALHAGHLSLIRKAQGVADHVVVYIFVNPLQFGPNEDLTTYPRNLEKDLSICEKAAVNTVFCPNEGEVYPEGKDRCTKVVPPSFLGDILEGKFRPGTFTGVSTAVSKFFNIVQPNMAIFGEKDYQQLVIMRRMVKDLNLPVTIYDAPTVREPDGLAVSSRNTYLTKEERVVAPCIYALLQKAAESIVQCRREIELEQVLQVNRLKFAEYKFELQYLEARDAEDLLVITKHTNKIILLTAAKLGAVRLIDNLIISKSALLDRV